MFFRKKSHKKPRHFYLLIGALLVVLIPLALASLRHPDQAKAAWYDDNWSYRQAIPVTSTNGSAQSNVFVSFTLDTATAITAGKLQSNCQDIRITDITGALLKYHVGRTNACNNAATTIDFLTASFPDGTSTYYVYYGNATALSQDVGAFSQSQASNYNIGSLATAETTTGPIVYWKFDEGQGTTANDSTKQGNTGTLGGTTIPTQQTEDACVSGKCLYFDGSTSKVTGSRQATGIQTVSFWLKPNTIASQGIFNFDGGIHKISTNASGVISATGFTSPTYYINGVATTTPTLTVNQWNFVEVTTATSFNSTASFTLGTDGTNFMKGSFDDVKLYNYARSSTQALADYNSKGAVTGSSSNLGSNPQNSSALSNGLVGYWKMDESSGNLTDSSGNGKTGTATGTTVAAGKFGNGRSFNGSSDYVDLGNNTFGTLLNGAAGSTASVWVKLSGTPSSGNTYQIFGVVIGSTGGGFQASVNASRQIGFGGRSRTSDSIQVVTSNTALSTGTWYLVTGVEDWTNNKVSIYINGVLDNTLSANFGSRTYVNSWTSGSDQIGNFPSNTRYLNGSLDEMRIYNRALSPAEITTLYNFSPGPVGYWNFDENQGSSFNDTSGNANNISWSGTLGPQWKLGKYGSAGNFDGSTNYGSLNTTTSLSSPFVAGAITVEGWINATSIPASGSNSVFTYGTTGNSFCGATYIVVGSTNQVTAGFQKLNTGDSSLSGTISTNTWSHVAMTFVNGGSLILYVNGVQSSSTTPAITLDSTSQIYNVAFGSSKGTANSGAADCGGTNYFNGKIDDFKVYNYVRTQQQITQDMNASHPPPGSPVGSPVGYWKFEEGYGTTTNNNGNSGSALNGTLNNFASPASATSGWTNSGKFGKALIFDGSDDYVSVSNKTAIQPLSGDWAVSFWMYRTGAGAGDFPQIIGSRPWTAAADKGWSVAWDSTNNKICTHFADGSAGWDVNTGGTAQCSSSSSTLNSWEYWVVVFDRTNSSLKYYKNGVLDVSRTPTFPTASINQTNNLYIGREIDGGNTRKLAAYLDEVKIYSYALTADQVKLDMNRGQTQILGALSDNSTYQPNATNQIYCISGDPTSCAAPVGEWNFEEGTGLTVNDTSGNANTGTWNGTGTKHWTPGKVGMGGNFNGSDDYVDIGSFNTTDTSGTVSMWVKYRSLTSGGGTWSWGSTNTGPVFVWALRLGNSTDTAIQPTDTVYVQLRVADAGSISYTLYASTTPIQTNQWYHIVLTGNGTTHTMFINGVQQTVSVTNGSNQGKWIGSVTKPSGTMKATIGNEFFQNASFNNINGIIDNVRYFNYIRTPAQIAWDYNRGAPIGWWKFDECQGSTLHDSSVNANNASNGNTGTITVGGSGTYTSLGTCSSSSTSTMWYNGASGKYNSSLAFDGTDDTVALPNDGSYFPTDNFTFSIWAKPASVSGVHGLWGYGRTGGSGRIDLRSNGSQWEAFAYLTSNTITGGTATVGQWSNIVLVKNGTTDKLYVNGVQVGSTTNLNPQINAGAGDLIHAIGQAEGVFFGGQVDEVKFYRYVLTSTQIQSLYNQGAAVQFAPVTGTP